MAGPEPYPQVKWTREQEQAYAEGRASAKSEAKGGKRPAPRSGGKKRRVVRTAAGARRYKVPIGSEIGSARNATAAQAQRDPEARGRYEQLVGDPRSQAQAMRKLNDGQLQRLSRVAYSFRSADPNVVRLRIGVANELRRRGMNVNDFGGLGPRGGGRARPAGPAPRPRRSAAKRVSRRKPPPAKKKPIVKPARSAMSARVNDRRLRELSVPQLRTVLKAFGRVAPDKRQSAARFLIERAVELGAPHLLGQSIIEAANLPDARRAEVIELAGRWKHGWIPLDGVAMRSKMKGGNGKPWWSGGKQSRRGSSTMARSLQGKRGGREGSGSMSGHLHSAIGVPKGGGTARSNGGKGVVTSKAAKVRYGAFKRPEVDPKLKEMDRARVSLERRNTSSGRRASVLSEVGLGNSGIDGATREQLQAARTKLRKIIRDEHRGSGSKVREKAFKLTSQQRHDRHDVLNQIEDKLGVPANRRYKSAKVGEGRPTEAQYLRRSRKHAELIQRSTNQLPSRKARSGKA